MDGDETTGRDTRGDHPPTGGGRGTAEARDGERRHDRGDGAAGAGDAGGATGTDHAAGGTRPDDRDGTGGADHAGDAGDRDGAAPDSAVAGAATGRRTRWSRREYSPEEIEAAKQAWRDVVPWDTPMSRGDKILVFSTAGVMAVMLLSLPLRPFLLASHPVALSFVTGSLSAIGAGAAFARIGEVDLWLVVVAGVFGMVKFDWLFWLAGRRWGPKVVTFFAPGDGAQRFVAAVRGWPAWAMPLVVIGAALPGVPAVAVFALAGLGRMRLVTFLLFDAIGAALMTGLVAGLGYGLGQYAVDVVLAVDKYALYLSLVLIVFVAYRSGRRQSREQAARSGA